jgi:hypothetical protein
VNKNPFNEQQNQWNSETRHFLVPINFATGYVLHNESYPQNRNWRAAKEYTKVSTQTFLQKIKVNFFGDLGTTRS